MGSINKSLSDNKLISNLIDIECRSANFFRHSLRDFIKTFPEIAHVKDSEALVYQAINDHNLKLFNFNSDSDFIGKTVFDLAKIMEKQWPVGYAQKIHEHDQQILLTKKSIKSQGNIFLNKDGYVIIHSIIKIPLFDKGQKVIGIMTLVFDETSLENVTSLRKHYKNFYTGNMANQKLLQHIGFMEGVNKGLTERETDCLISLLKFRAVKEIARVLAISPKTVVNGF